MGEAGPICRGDLWTRYQQRASEQDYCYSHRTRTHGISHGKTRRPRANGTRRSGELATVTQGTTPGRTHEARYPQQRHRRGRFQTEIGGPHRADRFREDAIQQRMAYLSGTKCPTYKISSSGIFAHPWSVYAALKQDTDFITVCTSYDSLILYRLAEKTILAQTEDQYPFATVYDQEASFYSFMQEELSNPQWYERFNTKVDVGEAIRVTRQHKVLLEYVAQELHQQGFTSLSATDQQVVRTDAQERCIAYAFLRQSGAQHAHLKMDLQNDYTN
jgi:hypothetical protein